MFIYKFMSGIVETITAAEDEGGFDPHEHRKVEKPTTYADTMIHMLKGSIGAGILAMPGAMRRLGVIYSSIGLILICLFATYCIQLLIAAQYHLCKRFRRGYMAYPKSMRLALQDGPPCLRWASWVSYYFVDVTLVTWQLGICVIYFVFVAENLKQVLDFHGIVMSIRLHLACLLPPLLVLNLVKDLKMLTPVSTISNIVTVFGFTLVFFYLVEDDVVVGEDKLEMKRLIDIPIFIGTALFALEAVGVVLAIEYNMERPRRFVGLCGLFNIGMTIICVLYLLVGVFGYLKYGNKVDAAITLNLPFAQKKAQAAKVLFAAAIFLSFPLQNFVAYNIIWRNLKKRVPEPRQCPIDYSLRIALVVVPWLLAVGVPHLGPFISLFGALCLSLLAMVFPAVMDVALWYPETYGPCYYKLVRDMLIIIIGMFCLTSGVYSSVLEIINA